MDGRATSPDADWRLTHRTELDGLRGLAILLVLAFHLLPRTFPGGKIGVDLFFVLSGFLITSLLINEHRDTGGVSIKRFYARRARRLLPALGIFLLVVGAVLAAQQSWGDLASLGYVAGYVANIARIHGELPIPVQHTWSLAVEEQFYLVWPILFGVLLYFRSRRALVGVLAIAIALVCLHRLVDPDRAINVDYVRIDFRADALLMGCLLACLFAWFRASTWPWWIPALVTLPYLALVIVRGYQLTGVGYTIVAAGWACALGAALTNGLAGRVLRVQTLGWLGLISYALYLWHYPVLYWLRGNGENAVYDAHAFDVIACLVLSIALAAASYWLVERHFIKRHVPQPVPDATDEQRLG